MYASLYAGNAEEPHPLQARMYNFKDFELELRWQDGSDEGRFAGTLPAMGSFSQSTFTGHVFKVINKNATQGQRTIETFTMSRDRPVYAVPPDPNNSESHKHPSYTAYLQAARLLEQIEQLRSSGDLDELSTLAGHPSESETESFTVTFYNFRTFDLELYFDDGTTPGKFTDNISAMNSCQGQSTYQGHAFKLLRRDGDSFELVQRFVMDDKIRKYFIEPEAQDATHPKYLSLLEERDHAEKYFQSTGVHWTGPYPPVAPSFPIYAVGQSIGQHVHTVPLRPKSHESSATKHLDLISLSGGFPEGPSMFLIRDVLSPGECDHVTAVAEPKLDVSKTGLDGRTSSVRTSMTAFLNPTDTPTLEMLHRRFVDILNITDEGLSIAAEPLQVVRYQQGEEYKPHMDITDKTRRLATLLIYLDEPEEGGGTSFPLAFGRLGMKISPKRGSAILFYSQLPDGNLDEMSLHAGMPVKRGVKRVCNLWLHSHADKHWTKEREEL